MDDIEENSWEEAELFGEFPIIPQWEAIADQVIAEHVEPCVHIPVESGFYHDLIEGDI